MSDNLNKIKDRIAKLLRREPAQTDIGGYHAI